MTADEALALIKSEQPHRKSRQTVLDSGYPGYDTSVGWFNYDDETIRDNAKRAIIWSTISHLAWKKSSLNTSPICVNISCMPPE